MKLKLAIIGVGHLGGAFVRGLVRAGAAADDLTLVTKPGQAESVQAAYSLQVKCDIAEAAGLSDVICFALKFADFIEAVSVIPTAVWAGKTIVSFMAGADEADLREHLGYDTEIVRAMPSLAVETLDGIIGYTRCSSELAEIFESLGYAFEIDSEDIEKVTAFSGCGPGFAAVILDAYVKAGIALGFSEKQANIIASHTFSAVAARGGDYKQLADAVATPGGATIAGIDKLQAGNIYGVLSSAVHAAFSRFSRE